MQEQKPVVVQESAEAKAEREEAAAILKAEEAAAKAAEVRAKSSATIGHLDALAAEIERIKRILRNHSIGE